MLQKFKENCLDHFDSTMKTIEHWVSKQIDKEKKPNEFNCQLFMKWLLKTKLNPYTFLPVEWGGYKNNPFITHDLFLTIQHSLLDDGEIYFVQFSIDDDPFRLLILFKEYSEEDIFKRLEIDKTSRFNKGRTFTITEGRDVLKFMKDVEEVNS